MFLNLNQVFRFCLINVIISCVLSVAIPNIAELKKDPLIIEGDIKIKVSHLILLNSLTLEVLCNLYS